MTAFQPGKIGSLELSNRLIRSATYEGRCDRFGFPDASYQDLYAELARNEVGAMITGFAYITNAGRAMQPKQAGIENESKIPFYIEVTNQVHKFGSRIFMQLAHAGRQTSPEATGEEVLGASDKISRYFNHRPHSIETSEALEIVERFANAALFARRGGFDGIQLHAAHGYLIHQFLSPSTNKRTDFLGIDQRIRLGTRFLDLLIERIRQKCGPQFPLLVKISGGGDEPDGFTEDQLISLIHFLNGKRIDAIEISYGTMDNPLNIFRGHSFPMDAILQHNPRYRVKHKILRAMWKKLAAPHILRKVKPFTPAYNLPYAELAKRHTDIPILCVGGFRGGREIEAAISSRKADFIALCRPFICEPDFVQRLKADRNYVSRCISCNLCAVLCDTPNPTRCHSLEASHEH